MRRRILPAALAAFAALFVSAASADISSTISPTREIPPPGSVVPDVGSPEDRDNNLAFNERQNVTLAAPLAVDITSPGTYDATGDLTPGSIPAGTCVNSHFVFQLGPNPTELVDLRGGVVLDTDVLGIMILDASLSTSDARVGNPTTTYPTGLPNRGFEISASDPIRDSATLETNGRTVRYHLQTRRPGDQLRIITDGCGPGGRDDPETLVLEPKAATNPVTAQEHCVTATVRSETNDLLANVRVRFQVTGASGSIPGQDMTDSAGEAHFCYSGPTTPGQDAIHAYADDDDDGVQDDPPPAGNEPFDDATKTWTTGPAHVVVLEPKLDENPVGTRHCVNAAVRDFFGNPVADVTVFFEVTGSVNTSGSDKTDAAGSAEFCYDGPTVPGTDLITATADSDDDGQAEPGEPTDTATKVWGPGDPRFLTLEPKAASNKVKTQHCVFASVTDAFLNPVPNVVVRFFVTGVNSQTGSDTTNSTGTAEFCYVGGQTAGPDVIRAFADSNQNGGQDPGEPEDSATKTWLAADPGILTLAPKADENPGGEEHCVSATVTDLFTNPNANVVVRFIVSGTNSITESRTTDDSGIAIFCYRSTQAGLDQIHAFADTNNNGVQDPLEPFDDATKLWQPGTPATLELRPEADTNPVDTEHCVQAEVKDVFGNRVANVVVRFDVEGASEQDGQPADEDGSDATNEFGIAEFCYTGPDLPGADTIHAYADTDNDNVQDAGEPFDDAAKTWTFPISTPGCEVTITNGGWIVTATGSRGTFGGNARVELDGTTRGEEEYQDHSQTTPINFRSTQIVAVVCSPDRTRADIFGTGTINGVGPLDFRIRVRDLGEPGSGAGTDTYQILVGPYVSGAEDNPLQGGNVQIHVFA